jgi:HEAT repeat protein
VDAAREPRYDGHSLSWWLEKVQRRPGQTLADREQAAEAVRKMGPEALPALLEMARAADARMRERAFWAYMHLGTAAKPHLSELTEMLAEDRYASHRGELAIILGNLGPDATAAVPVLARFSTDDREYIRCTVIGALGQIHGNPEITIPALVKGLDDSSAAVWATATFWLGEYGPQAKAAVPGLQRRLEQMRKLDAGEAIKSENMKLVDALRSALKKIEPEWAAAGTK